MSTVYIYTIIVLYYIIYIYLTAKMSKVNLNGFRFFNIIYYLKKISTLTVYNNQLSYVRKPQV